MHIGQYVEQYKLSGHKKCNGGRRVAGGHHWSTGGTPHQPEYPLQLPLSWVAFTCSPVCSIDQSHRYGRHQAACREPAGTYDKTTRTAICFEHKTQYILIRAPYTRIVVFWHISNIPPRISQSQISCNTPTFYIAAIYLWNIVIQPAVGCYNSWANLRSSGCYPLREILLWNRSIETLSRVFSQLQNGARLQLVFGMLGRLTGRRPRQYRESGRDSYHQNLRSDCCRWSEINISHDNSGGKVPRTFDVGNIPQF